MSMLNNRFNKVHPRVIVNLLLENSSAVNTVKYKFDQYLGDPLNLVKIFNDKEVDEMIISSKTASKNGINFELLNDIASNSRFPLSYVGGIKTIDDAKKIIRLGYEKISLCSTYSPSLLQQIAGEFGSSAISVSIDLKKDFFGNYKRYNNYLNKYEPINIEKFCKDINENGAGELILNYIDRDGTYLGYDMTHIHAIKDNINIPVIINNGCAGIESMTDAKNSGFDAFSATSIFVFYGEEKGILPSFIDFKILQEKLS